MNYLMIESLQRYHYYFGDDFQIEFPTGSGQRNEPGRGRLRIVAPPFANLPARSATAAVRFSAESEKFQTDPNFRDYVWFNEYFHGDNGAGIGANHQTGWTALVAKLLQQSGE